jgi:chemotaxis protein MotA
MTWFQGIPGALIIAGAAITLAGLALFAAKSLRLDRALLGMSTPSGPSGADQVRLLAELADLAHREGVLSLEARVGQMNDDFLARGIAMAVEGAGPDEIRAAMETQIDLGAHGLVKSAVLMMARYPQAGTIVGAGALLGFMGLYAAQPQSARGAALTGLSLFFFGIAGSALIGPLADRIAAREAASILNRLLQAEAVALIRSGFDGKAVAARLSTLLPAPGSGEAGLARAA